MNRLSFTSEFSLAYRTSRCPQTPGQIFEIGRAYQRCNPYCVTISDSRWTMRVSRQLSAPKTRSNAARGIILRSPSFTVGIVPFSMPSLIVR